MHEMLEAAGTILDDVVALRRDVHRHPELGLDNPSTQRRIIDALDGLPLAVRAGEGLTSVVADLDGEGSGQPATVLLRADTDALPMTEESGEDFCSVEQGRAHACGHDAHTAMLVGAARLLSDMRDRFAGRVRFMFQPGEEGAGGAPIMIDEGVLDGVDRAFALHITPNLPIGFAGCRAGPMLASTDEISVTVTGRGGHASMPHLCVDPVPPMAAMIGALQTAITREINAFDPALVTVAHVEAGTTHNVIPEIARFEGTIRCVSEGTRDQTREAVERVCASIASAHRCTAEVRIQEGYPVTVNDAGEAARFARACAETLGPDGHVEFPSPVMGGEDFSYLLQQVPGAMAFLGVCPADVEDSLTAPPCHSNRMRLNEDGMAHGVALHMAMALDR